MIYVNPETGFYSTENKTGYLPVTKPVKVGIYSGWLRIGNNDRPDDIEWVTIPVYLFPDGKFRYQEPFDGSWEVIPVQEVDFTGVEL